MSRLLAASLALLALAAPALAQTGAEPALRTGQPGRNIAATGRTMPPADGRRSTLSSGTESAMLKAQKAAEERNKAWDTKTRRTMGTICNGC